MTASEQASSGQSRGARFIKNVLWSWIGTGAALASGFIISPYLIRKLGPEAYGIWAISLALIENYGFLDLGFRSATVKFVAHHWASNEPLKVNEVVNTGLMLSATVAAIVLGAVVAGAHYLTGLFKVSEARRHDFVVLLILVTFSWCLGWVLQTFATALEAMQRFDLSNHAIVLTTTMRAIGTGTILYLGHGLIAIGVVTLISQLAGYLLSLYNFKRIFPELRIGFRYASRATMKKLFGFGIHTFFITISYQVLNQGPPVLIGHFLSATAVTFFQLPLRLLMFTSEGFSRIGIITNNTTAELAAKGDHHLLAQMAVYINRYCVILYMPLAIVFWTWGDRFFKLWVPNIAEQAAPILPILLIGYLIAVVGQFSSYMLLQGLARHQGVARGMMVEAVAALGLMIAFIPRYGIISAAWIVAVLMVLDRGLYVPWLLSREMKIGFFWYLGAIYLRPALAAAPVVAFSYWLRAAVLPGNSWFQLAEIGIIVAAVYFALAFLFSVPGEHRTMARGWVARRLGARTAAAG